MQDAALARRTKVRRVALNKASLAPEDCNGAQTLPYACIRIEDGRQVGGVIETILDVVAEV